MINIPNNFICVSAQFWNEKWERMQQLSLRFAESGKVLYLEPIVSVKEFRRFTGSFLGLFFPNKFIKEVKSGLFVYPLVALMPLGRIGLCKGINGFFVRQAIKRIIRKLEIANPILFIWDFWEADKYIGKMGESLVALDYFDNYLGYQDYSQEKKRYIGTILHNAMQKSDVVFATSYKLFEQAQQHNPNTHLAPNGVDLNNYFRDIENKGYELSRIPRPIIGYMGGNNYATCKKLDYDLLNYLADKFPKYSFVFIGPKGVNGHNRRYEILRSRTNVYFLGEKRPVDLPGYLQKFEVCIIPWKVDNFSSYIYPLKLNEYLACGKPVVSTVLPDLVDFEKENHDLIYIAGNFGDFAAKIEQALKQNNRELERKRIEAARGNSWQRRAKEMVRIMDKALEEKRQKPGAKTIVQIFNSRIAKWGSFEDFMVELSRQAKDRNIDLHFVFPAVETEAVRAAMESLGANIHIIKGSWQSFGFVSSLLKLIKTIKPNAVDIHFCASLNLGWLFLMLKMAKVKIIFHYHGEIRPVQELKFINRHLSKLRLVTLFADEIICVSEANKAFLEALNIKKKISVVYNGINLKHFSDRKLSGDFKQALGFNNGELIVTTIGALIPRKGIEILLQAAREVIKEVPQARFVVVGAGEQKQYLRLAVELGIEYKVIFTGLKKTYPFEILQATEVYVSASYAESFGLSIAEAQLLGVPVVATKVGGVPEVVEDGVTGLLVPAGDSAALAGEIVKLLLNKGQRRQLGEAGRRRITDKFNLARTTQELFSYF